MKDAAAGIVIFGILAGLTLLNRALLRRFMRVPAPYIDDGCAISVIAVILTVVEIWATILTLSVTLHIE